MATAATLAEESVTVSRRNHIRTTIVLPAALDQNLEIFCAREGKSKNQAVIQALKTMLENAGLEPFKLPRTVRFDVSY